MMGSPPSEEPGPVGGRPPTGPGSLLAALLDGAEWRRRAACRGAGTSIFFPSQGQSVEPALAFCRRCPVVAECREDALAYGIRHGVWGGQPERQRRRTRDARRRDEAA